MKFNAEVKNMLIVEHAFMNVGIYLKRKEKKDCHDTDHETENTFKMISVDLDCTINISFEKQAGEVCTCLAI